MVICYSHRTTVHLGIGPEHGLESELLALNSSSAIYYQHDLRLLLGPFGVSSTSSVK